MSWSAPPVFTVGQVLTAAQQNILSDDLTYLKASELAYNEFTSPVSVTATTEATANTVVTASAVTFDGSTVVLIEAYAPSVSMSTTNVSVTSVLFQDGVAIGEIAHHYGPTATFVKELNGKRRLTPAAGARTYSMRSYVNTGTGTITVGAGGSGASVPGYIRITKV